jgi:hypothetical protein
LIRERRNIKAAPTKSCGRSGAQHMQTGVGRDSQHAKEEARRSHHKRGLTRTIWRSRGDALLQHVALTAALPSLKASVCIGKFFHHSRTLRATALFHLGPHPTSTRPHSRLSHALAILQVYNHYIPQHLSIHNPKKTLVQRSPYTPGAKPRTVEFEYPGSLPLGAFLFASRAW